MRNLPYPVLDSLGLDYRQARFMDNEQRVATRGHVSQSPSSRFRFGVNWNYRGRSEQQQQQLGVGFHSIVFFLDKCPK